ncbi:patatin family protein [Macrococcus hajekii]|uniref:Patatin family protein n=2 Tax=Macrococcus hajekii TaxID=198482 RepID=A0A4V3BED6_9STAP|nr:patatin family protein [Macrococcus hajekii]TDM02104.1 patatin family protein [Macrococcus hajekii]GGB10109.1 patatin family protein [Macrococcus hajekii]
MEKKGLVLEGGGMRGIYTAGVLDCFLNHEISFDYVIGVSAGGNMAASYLSKQKGRNKRVTLEYLDDKRYLSIGNYIKNREMFGMDFLFDEIPNVLEPYHMDDFLLYEGEYVIACTNCETGETEYYDKSHLKEDMLTILRASSSLPLMAPVVEYKGKKLLDGGVTDPIPLRKAQQDGIKKNVVVLTRPKGYFKKSSRIAKYFKVKQYPAINEAMRRRPGRYNETLHYIEREAEAGHVLLIRPSLDLKVDRMEKNRDKLHQLYELGYRDAEQKIRAIKDF